MRKTLFFCTCIAVCIGLLSGCRKPENPNIPTMSPTTPTQNAHSSESMWGDVKFETGIYHNKNWNAPDLTYEGDVVPDKIAAIRIANAIFEGIRTEEQKGHAPQLVFYDEKDEVWIVCFWDRVDDLGNIIVGGEVDIAIQRADGKVLRIWMGE